MSIIQQISKGLREFAQLYADKSKDAIIHTSVEIRMNPTLEARIREEYDAESFARFEADFEQYPEFVGAPPLPTLRHITHLFGCVVALDGSLSDQVVAFGFNDVTGSILIV